MPEDELTTIRVSTSLVQRVVKAMDWNTDLPVTYAVDQGLRELLKCLEKQKGSA